MTQRKSAKRILARADTAGGPAKPLPAGRKAPGSRTKAALDAGREKYEALLIRPFMERTELDNGDSPYDDDGDNIGVVVPWSPPDAFDGVTADHLRRVQRAVDDRSWKESSQAKNWVGIAVANAMGLDKDAKADRARIGTLLRQWIANGALVVVEKQCPKRREEKKFIEVGEWALDGVAPPAKGGAGQGGASGAPKAPCPTPPPVGGGGGGQVRRHNPEVGRGGPFWRPARVRTTKCQDGKGYDRTT